MKANVYPRVRQRGFSIVELLIVVAIMMVVAAFALPTITNSINVMRLRMTMGSVSGTFQECRSVAVRLNRLESVVFSTTSGRIQAKVQPTINPDPDKLPDRVMEFPAGMALSTTPPTALPSNIWNSTSTDVWPASTNLSFNPRGLPCGYTGTSCDSGGGNKGFIFYFSYTPSGSTTQWIAVSVSPAGRIKSWYLNNGVWGD